MRDRFWIPLFIVSTLLFVYGVYTFWQGKLAVDQQRQNSRPQEITLDTLPSNPPRNDGWYRITQGTGVLIAGMAVHRPIPSTNKPGPIDSLYYPLLPNAAVPQPYYKDRKTPILPPAFVLVHSNEEKRIQFADLLSRMRGENGATYIAWLEQNRTDAFPTEPLEGVLHKPTPDDKAYLRQYSGSLSQGFWILEENTRPAPSENPRVALGLTLMLGVPTFWVFTLLITGKLAPPDEDYEGYRDYLPPETTDNPSTPISYAPSSVMPIHTEEATKKPHR